MADGEVDWNNFDPLEIVYAGSESLKNVSRVRLFKQVWSMPLKKVAELYDCEYFHLRAACKEAGIPTPTKGHWAKVAAGKPVDLPPSLPPHPRAWNTVPLSCGFRAQQKQNEARRTLRRRVEEQQRHLPASRQSRLHPVVATLRDDRLSKTWGGQNRQISSLYEGPLTSTEKRAFQALSYIIRELEREGFQSEASRDGYVRVSRQNASFCIRARELLKQTQVKQDVDPKFRSFFAEYKREFVRTGHIIVEFDRGRRWTEKDDVNIESFLPTIIEQAVFRNLADIEDAKRRDQQELERQERQRRAELEREKLRLKKEAWEKFVSAAKLHAEMEELRRFLSAARAATPDLEAEHLGRSLGDWFAELDAMIEERDLLKDGGRGLVARFFDA